MIMDILLSVKIVHSSMGTKDRAMSFDKLPFSRYNGDNTRAMSKARKVFFDIAQYFPKRRQEYAERMLTFPGWKKGKVNRRFVLRKTITDLMLTTALFEAENVMIAEKLFQNTETQDPQTSAIFLALKALGVINKNSNYPQVATQNEISIVLKFIVSSYNLHPCFPYTREELSAALQYKERR